MHSSRAIPIAGLLVALASSTSCKEEDTRLFDETGVWALEKFSITGDPYMDVAQTRKNRFLLRFKPDDMVVAAAACTEEGTVVSVTGSSCINAGLSSWNCQCFSYTYENSVMVWQEFTPGDPPPGVGTPSGGETDGMDAGGAHSIMLEAFMDSVSTYEFNSLPLGVFNSDGEISSHVFLHKADAVWVSVDIDDDGVPDLEECSSLCFPSEAGGG